MEFDQHPDFAQSKAEHDGKITAAKAASDELAELRAQLEWRDKVDHFKTEASKYNAREAAVTKAKADAKAQFAHAPEVIYQNLNDPEAIMQAAKAAHDSIAAAMGTQQPPQGSQPWPTPPTGNAGPPPGSHRFDDPTNWAEQMHKVRTMNKPPNQGIDNPEFQKMEEYVLERLWKSPLQGGG